MATFTAIRNKKQTAGSMLGVLSYVVQAKKTVLDGAWLVTGSDCVPQASYLEMMTMPTPPAPPTWTDSKQCQREALKKLAMGQKPSGNQEHSYGQTM